jgi:proteasome lid subunit RPN8/RPN11
MKMIEKVVIKREALELFLDICKDVSPNENIMLIRGKVKNGVANVKEFLIPPFSTYGQGFSGFSSFMVPFDLSIIGVAHSHPSGNANPSTVDLNHIYGRIMIIVGYPYLESSVNAYGGNGERLPIVVE